jgi:O-antigen/teichoic acid export membrane protein
MDKGRRQAILRAGHRAKWAVGDQALSSLSNFALGVLVARSVTQAGLGAFSLAFASYTIALNGSRALISSPVLVRHSATEDADWRSGVRSAAGAALCLGTVVGAICLVIALLTAGAMQQAFLGLAVAMPGLLLQDLWRFSFFAGRREPHGFVNDFIWAVILLPTLAILSSIEQQSVGWYVVAWGGAASVAAIVGVFQAGVLPRPSETVRWLRKHRDLGPRFLGEFAAIQAGREFVVYFTAAVAGLAATGSLRAAEVLLGPMNVLFMSAPLYAIPEGTRLLKRSPRKLKLASVAVGSLLGCAAVIWGFLVQLLPASLGTELLGQSWDAGQRVAIPLAVGSVATGMTMGATIGLRALAAAKHSLRARVIVSILLVVCSGAGAVVAGGFGAASGLAVALWVGVVVWWRSLLSALRDYRPADETDADVTVPSDVRSPTGT